MKQEGRSGLSLHENHQHRIMYTRPSLRIKNTQEDQPGRAHDGGQNGAYAQKGFGFGVVVCQATAVPQPPFGDEGEVEDDDHDGATGDEERS